MKFSNRGFLLLSRSQILFQRQQNDHSSSPLYFVWQMHKLNNHSVSLYLLPQFPLVQYFLGMPQIVTFSRFWLIIKWHLSLNSLSALFRTFHVHPCQDLLLVFWVEDTTQIDLKYKKRGKETSSETTVNFGPEAYSLTTCQNFGYRKDSHISDGSLKKTALPFAFAAELEANAYVKNINGADNENKRKTCVLPHRYAAYNSPS